MKFLILSMLCAVVPAGAAQLKDVKAVYVYPMSGGLDQLLANRLTEGHVFQVVSDPKLADAVFTDQLGAAFEYRLNHITPAVPVPPPAAPVPGGAMIAAGAGTEPPVSTFSRGRGTIFLVDAKSKQVVWSAYERPKNGSPQAMERTAKKVVSHLTVSLKPEPAK